MILDGIAHVVNGCPTNTAPTTTNTTSTTDSNTSADNSLAKSNNETPSPNNGATADLEKKKKISPAVAMAEASLLSCQQETKV